MENKSVSSFKTALNYGFIAAVLLIVYGLVLFLLDIGFESMKNFGYFSYIIVLVILVLGIRSYKIANGGFISYGQAFTVSFLIVLVAFFISNIYNYVYFTYIDPGMTEEIATQAIAQAEQGILDRNPEATQSEIDMAITMAEKFTTPLWMTIWGFVWSVIVGTIVSLIIPIFMMKKNPADV